MTPPLTTTVERGDLFIKKSEPMVVYEVIEKAWNHDMTVTYRLAPNSLKYNEVTVHEDGLKKWPWLRAWKAKRSAHERERIFTGVFYGTA